MPAVALPAPVALARLTDSLTPPGVREPVWQPKWDGYRCTTAAGRLYSRRGTNLTPYFPDLAPVLAARLPDDLVLDGELVAWDTTAGRLDFASLQDRMTAGRRLRAVVERRPAQFVAFDVLAADGKDLRSIALRDRRRVLERALSGLASPIVLCQQTTDVAVAEEWMSTLTAGGIEGLVIKDASSTYPTRDGQRVWRVDCTVGVVDDRVSAWASRRRDGLGRARAAAARADRRVVLAVAGRHGRVDGPPGRAFRAA